MTALPTCLADIEAGWVHEQLVANGHESPGVTAVSYEPMSGNVGVLGEVGVVTITYAGPTDLPQKMVAKCPLDDELAQLINSMMSQYEREAGFYRDLAHQMPMRVPTPYVVAESGDKSQQLLMIEFIAAGTDGDVLEGTTFERAMTIVEDLAKMHGQFWMHDEMANLDWMRDWSEESLLLGVPMIAEAWGKFHAAEPDVYPPALKDALERTWINDTAHWLQVFHNMEGWTFGHLDYELDNMRFTPDGEIVVLDWQTCMRTFPGADLSFTLAWLNTRETVAREDELLDCYRETLAASGGPTWSRDEVIDQCAWGVTYTATGMTMPLTSDHSAHGPEHERRTMARLRHGLDGLIAGAVRWNTAERIASAIR